MPNYIMLMKWTDQGIKDIKNVAQRVQGNVKAFEALGGKVTAVYVVMGEYDLIAIGEAPSDEVATTFALGVGAQGNARTTTLKAFTMEQFAGVVKKLP
jgi:uncharacterized protein with GYD domain